MNQLMYKVEQALLSNALQVLRDKTGIQGTLIELHPNEVADYQAHASIALVLDRKTHHYIVECRAAIDRKAQLDQLDLRLRKIASPIILITEYLSKELAVHCRAINLQFIDSHGNAYLRGPGLFVFTSGEKDARKHKLSKVPRGLTNAASLRVIFALLSKPELVNRTFKEIAVLSDVAVGTAYNVLGDLERRGYLVASSKDSRKVLEPNRLVEEWVVNFPTTLRTKLKSRRFSCPDPCWWKNLEITDFHAVWGSEVAAAKMCRKLSPSTQTLYVAQIDWDRTIQALARKIRMRPDPDGPIEVIEKFWSQDIETCPGIAPPLLVYSDLLALLDPRAKETATLIKTTFIKPMINQD